MGLQAFIEQHDTDDFVKRNLGKMNEHISMVAVTHGKIFEGHLSQADNCYFSIYGYIYAMYAMGKYHLVTVCH